MARSGLAFPPPSSDRSQAPPRFEWSSSGSSYRPSEHTPPSTSPSRYTNPSQHLDSQRLVRNIQMPHPRRDPEPKIVRVS